jgi:hypothetical protein
MIRDRLAEVEPGNSTAQQDLAQVYGKIADMQ